MPAVQQSLADADGAVRLAALAAMARLVDVVSLDLLIDKALAAGQPGRNAAARTALQMAAQRMGDRDGLRGEAGRVARRASAANRKYLFELLGSVSGPKALGGGRGRPPNPSDPATKDAATRVLGEWLNTDAAPALLEIAKNDPEKKYQIRALRGYIRIARQLEIPWLDRDECRGNKTSHVRQGNDGFPSKRREAAGLGYLAADSLDHDARSRRGTSERAGDSGRGCGRGREDRGQARW